MKDKNKLIKTLATHQLILVHDRDPENIEKEWKWRWGTDYPYRLSKGEMLYMEEPANAIPPEIQEQADKLGMTEEERLSIIEQLALITGHHRDLYMKLSNAQLKGELKRHYAN